MQTFEIKNRYTDKVIFSEECETLVECVESAVGKKANLSGANLSTVGTVKNFTTISRIGSRGATHADYTKGVNNGND